MSQSDEDAIRALEHRFNEAWNAHDPEGLAESLADDAQFITVNGAWTTSRAGLPRPDGAAARRRTARSARARARSPEMQVRFLAPDIAILHTRFWIDGEVHARHHQPAVARERRHPRAAQDRRALADRRNAEHRRPPRPAALRRGGMRAGAFTCVIAAIYRRARLRRPRKTAMVPVVSAHPLRVSGGRDERLWQYHVGHYRLREKG